ncbi:MAG: hypothetical protein KKA60_00930 [Proteobacteria bacterium]|nr:hypothetical protein [Pseudomonadota bacterium]
MTSGTTSERIWQAMRGREVFNAPDVARAAGVRPSAVMRRLCGFCRAGLAAPAGFAGRPGGGVVRLWRLSPHARHCLAPPPARFPGGLPVPRPERSTLSSA